MPPIVSRLLGYLPWGLGAALLVASAFASVQTFRLGKAEDLVQAQKVSIDLYKARILSDAASIAQRDVLIERQNAAVRSLVEQQAADRTAYLARIAQADRRAQVLQAQANDIMNRTTEATGELERAREALKLIQEVVGEKE